MRLAIEALMEDPQRGKALHMDLKGLRSWRTGDFRIVYTVMNKRLEIHVVAVGHRGEVYARLRKRLG